MQLVVGNFEKSAKLPPGTRRKYGKSWFIKMGDGTWAYDGSANSKNTTSSSGKQSVTKKKDSTTSLFDGLEPYTPQMLANLQADTTRRDRMGEGQEVTYTGRYHKWLTGKKAKLIAIGKNGYAMLQFHGGKPITAKWTDIKPSGPITPHSLYDKLDAKNVYSLTGDMKKKVDEVMNQKIGSSGMTYQDLCRAFKKEGFNLQVVGGTCRDIISGKDEVNDIDFIFNGTDNELKYVVRKLNPNWLTNAVTNSHLGLVSFTDGKDVVDITPVHKFSPEMNDMAKGWNLKDDATSRDVAMNTIHIDTLTGVVVDATGDGLKDIKANTINFTDEKQLAIAPRYVLRVFKFIGRGYKPTPSTESMIKRNLKYTANISYGRRAGFMQTQIFDKDGLDGMKKFRNTFMTYDKALWKSAYESPWNTVYKNNGGRP